VHAIGLNVKYVPKQVVQQPMVGQLAVNFPLFMQPGSALLFTITDTELCAEPHVFSPHHILCFDKIPFCYKPRDKDISLFKKKYIYKSVGFPTKRDDVLYMAFLPDF
jgi:hypothetical protein